ncbi:acyl-CoA thioesterase [Streptomyces bambusae]|uniref:acyl-CoA thioesterase n=1 Tax=Streptomyces bambusae TaxID=1550616 RepID=UPI001CFD28A6|nr:acyl-CoA thioesterase [Streptomyces bambusae]MCB5165625.1 acyl-CoA thioesterase [Streptomyces bambusae]
MTGHADGPGYFEYRHTVAFAETDLGGTADFVQHLRWQARCRQLFLRGTEFGTAVGDDLDTGRSGLRLFTQHVECELFEAVAALDRLSVRMRVADIGHTQFDLTFDYVKGAGQGGVTVARGRQRIVCLRGPAGAPVPALIPDALAQALAPYAAGPRSLAGRQI